MRKTLLIAGILAASLAVHTAARADTLSDWIAMLFGISINDTSGPQPNDGPGTGTGIAD
jgi:hypothetical protein